MNGNRATTAMNNAVNKVSSFVATPVNAITNVANNAVNKVNSLFTGPIQTVANAANDVATNVSNSVKNVFNNTGMGTMMEPLQESVKVTMENTPHPFVSVPIIIALGIFIILFIIVVMFRQQIAFGMEVMWEKMKDAFGMSKPAVQAPPPEFVPKEAPIDQGAVEKILPGKKEVFNIATNKYTYSDADPLCKAFGAELATYDQVKDAWQKGADWCNYGWVKGQTAIYPTQESTFNKLQMGPEDQRMACGVPGVNGGYFDNPELKFGVNCYGVKPSEKDKDSVTSMLDKVNLTPEALAVDKKILDYKSSLGQIPVNPFKPGAWSS